MFPKMMKFLIVAITVFTLCGSTAFAGDFYEIRSIGGGAYTVNTIETGNQNGGVHTTLGSARRAEKKLEKDKKKRDKK